VIRRLLLWATAATLLATPSFAADLIETARANGNLGMFLQLVRAAGLEAKLKTEGPFTIFAPDDNHGFMEIEDSSLFDELLASDKRLREFVGQHIVPGKLSSAELGFQLLQTLTPDVKLMTLRKDGRVQVFGPYQGGVRINGGFIVAADIAASNGVIHVIDSIVRLPRPAN
jgi:uncharacterized surface protein with fasciclin (FAS1) repeats